MDNEDQLYISQFLEGQEKGFEILVKKYQNRVLNIAYSLTGRSAESEDITQEAFLKAYYGLKDFKGGSQFFTWLYRITVNTAYDFLRRRKRFVNDDGIIEKSASAYEDPQGVLIKKERETAVRLALEKVPLKFRAALVLKDVEGLSYLEIAGVLRCGIGTVESKIYRARQFLREELLKSGFQI